MDTLVYPPSVSLDDKYSVEGSQVFITGVQALVRLPMLRREVDAKNGLNTAGFISGYRGSPLGTYDKQLWQEKKRLSDHHIVFRPGLNEELAATAVWGSQQTGLFEGARYDGVFGIWYGKGPGVDRSGDAFKHANMFGDGAPWRRAGARGRRSFLQIVHASQSERLRLHGRRNPGAVPADIGELIEFGMKAFDLSRFAGLWVGMKAISDTMDASATVRIDPARYAFVMPQGVAEPPGGRNGRLRLTPQRQEEIHRHFRLQAALAFARANRFDRIVLDSPRPRFGIAASGKGYLHVRQALHDLGVSDRMAAALGIRIYKIGLVWPLEEEGARAFANGLETVLVVEERRDVIEHQLRAAAYGLADGRRPRILGKRDASGAPLVSDVLDIDTAHVACAILRVMPEEWKTERMREHEARLNQAAMPAARAAARPHALLLLGLPAQHIHPRSRRKPRGGRHWLPLPRHAHEPQHGQLYPDGRRRRALGRASAFHGRAPHLR